MTISNKGILNCSTRLPHGRIQRGSRGSGPPPLKNYRNTGFHSNAGPDPLKNHWLSRLFIATLWFTWRERTDLLAVVCDVYFDFVSFPFGILGQMWYLIVSIPDPCCLSYFL